MVPLREELNNLSKYITIQEYRTRNNVVDIQIDETANDIIIPPLLLITLVENAFKHGIYSDNNNPILIRVTVDKKKLNFIVKNKINPNRIQNSTAIGLSSMKRILELTYGPNYELTIEDNNEYYKTSLILNTL